MTPELLAPGEREKIQAAIDALAATAKTTDHTAIKVGIEELDAASKQFAARRMNRALEQGLAGRDLARVEKDVDEHAVVKRQEPAQ